MVADEDDEAEETIEELRFYARSRLGDQAHHLHPSWGARSVNELSPRALRGLCHLILLQEPEWPE